MERLTLYLVASVGGGLVCLLGLLAARLAWSRRKPSVPPSTGFTGQLFEGDIDLTVATPLPTEPSDVVRFSATSPPRSLSAGNSQYYFG